MLSRHKYTGPAPVYWPGPDLALRNQLNPASELPQYTSDRQKCWFMIRAVYFSLRHLTWKSLAEEPETLEVHLVPGIQISKGAYVKLQFAGNQSRENIFLSLLNWPALCAQQH